MATKTFKIPKQIAAAADMYYERREARLALERQAEVIKAEEQLLKTHLIDNIPKSLATGVAGKLVRVSVVNKDVPVVKDWDALYAYIAKNRAKGAFALLNRAVNAKAVGEIWEANKTVPGVEAFQATMLSMNKL